MQFKASKGNGNGSPPVEFNGVLSIERVIHKKKKKKKEEMESGKVGVWEGLMKTHKKSLNALFSRKNSNGDQTEIQESCIPHFSPLANSVVSRSSRSITILSLILFLFFFLWNIIMSYSCF